LAKPEDSIPARPSDHPPALAISDQAGLVGLGRQIEAAHQRAAQHAHRALEAAWECGRLLEEAKAALGHGAWLPWLQAHTTVSPRQAQRYMRLAEHRAVLEGKYDAATHLTLTEALAELATPRLPASPLDDNEAIWAWAEGQLSGPFNGWDFAQRGPRWLTTKLLHQLALPAVTALLLEMGDEYHVPALRLAPDDELEEALRVLVPHAKGTAPALPLDAEGMSAQEQMGGVIALKLIAMRAVALLFSEIEHRAGGAQARLGRRFRPARPTMEARLAEERTAVHVQLMERIDAGQRRVEREGVPADG
jgi:hypothetical protein